MLEAVGLGDGGKAHQEIVKTLLQAGADKSITDNDDKTSLELAETRGHGYGEGFEELLILELHIQYLKSTNKTFAPLFEATATKSWKKPTLRA